MAKTITSNDLRALRNVIPFPNDVATPVVQTRRRGRLPASVTRLADARASKAADRAKLRAEFRALCAADGRQSSLSDKLLDHLFDILDEFVEDEKRRARESSRGD
ncbi:hypothetical protein ACNRBS_10545 [Ralstonia pseudosolanacearum]|uniref:Uncharacterized protein n=1 Tax=Ralstonia solanacearum TaxID=305 RepID=A0A0S4V2W8_RALSL|nr:hypothetical protein [Ralstonia pseudosolanacearum]CUV28871.1 conserved protein of unknown function [Ralstonia solanacearum]BCL91937.1 hypothetical protein MAFF211479_16380 [Ralstonia solanacearum]BCL97763.1 hypothetical protein MAFF211491_22150 [Ralstonia solanacearum]BCM13205.1 hypothetical protein MAFF241648_23950 [Ralstonia solanacearum]BCN04501.1 hypothetical protein RPSB_16380 [Ralstonia solanacearum]